MVLRTEKLIIDGKEVIIKELSFAAQARLSSKEKSTIEDVYKECISPWDVMEETGKEDIKRILEAYMRVNGKGEPDKSPIAPKKPLI